MRDFFIGSLETILNVVVVIAFLVLLVAAGAAAFGPGMGPMGQRGGPLAGLFVLIGGGIYLLMIFGFLYLGLGIYQNTRRTAEAVEKLANR